MFLPETYQLTLALMILSMLCWGSWANTLKLCPNFRFQLFYWDYSIGLFAGAVLLGSPPEASATGPAFCPPSLTTSRVRMLWAFFGGVIFNVANLLLVAAIDVAGLAVAFPVGIGLALVVGAVSSYLVSPPPIPFSFSAESLSSRSPSSLTLCLSQTRKHREGSDHSRHRPQPRRRRAHGQLLPARRAGMRGEPGGSPGPYAIAFLLRHRRPNLHHPR